MASHAEVARSGRAWTGIGRLGEIAKVREPGEWLALMADPLVAQSAIDRACSTTHELVIEGESYRRRQEPTNNTGVSIDTNAQGDQDAC